MDKKKSFIAAFVVLSQQGYEVTSLEFEDGSGYCFNFKAAGKCHFIDMREDDMTLMVFEAVRDQK